MEMGSRLKVSPDSLEKSAGIEHMIPELKSDWIIRYTMVAPLQLGSKPLHGKQTKCIGPQ